MPDFRFGRLPSVKLPKAPLLKAKLPSPKGMWGEEQKREQITPATRNKVWQKRFGDSATGICVCCRQRTIHRDDFACGHRRAYASRGSNNVSNLEPICGRCNKQMGTHDLVSWCKKFREELKPKTKPKRKAKTTRKKATAKKKK